ncbi:porin [Thioclava sp.]|uniref:porin n=1 Tax=Thioclava sp. TaxID=1933450 RepID=UPI003AA84CBE
MKKVLFATTALVLSAGFASADVTLSGYGRFGLQYNSKPGVTSGFILGAPGVDKSKATVETRMRLNIDASTETDGGVTFGGRIRVQYDNGKVDSTVSPALMYATYGGFRMEVGNANTALDSAPLVYGSELGLVDSSFGDIRSSFYAFNSDWYGATGASLSTTSTTVNSDRMGVSASYSMGGFSGMLSYITPDQATSSLRASYGAGVKAESSLYLAYASGPLTVAAAGTWNAAGVDGNDIAFIGAAYQVNDAINLGLNYTDEAGVLGETVVGYGSYTMGATTFRAYVANNTAVANLNDTAYGIGADYDLGGATLKGGIQYGYAEETVADFGVKFAF